MPPRRPAVKADIRRWIPNPGPQSLLLTCPAELVLFGGMSGGGKTDGLIACAAMGLNYTGYKAILFRRTYQELEKHIIERSRELFSAIGKYDDKDHCWTFNAREGGRSQIFFGYLERDAQVYTYHGGEYAFIGFDESTFFSEFQIRFMLTRLRSSHPLVRRRVVLGSNPIGPGFGYHKQIFVEDAVRGELKPCKIYSDAHWPSDGKQISTDARYPIRTCFIPSSVYDNPVLMKADPGYIARIKTQSAGIARALLGGSWKENIFVAVEFDAKVHTCDPIPIPADAPRWIGIDWGKTDIAAVAWLTSFGGRTYAYRDASRPGRVIRPFAEELVARCAGEQIQFVVLSHECFADRGMGHTQADQFIEVFSRANIPVVKSDRDPEGRLLLLREFLRLAPGMISEASRGIDDYDYWQARVLKDGEKAWKEYARLREIATGEHLPRLLFFRRSGSDLNIGCPYLINSLPLLVTDIEKPYRIAEHQDDHGFDALTHALKGWVNYDETSLMEAYMTQLGGKIPDSSMAAEFAMAAAKEKYAEDEGGDAPFEMGRERWRDGGGGGELDIL
jgi:hypothetical protein